LAHHPPRPIRERRADDALTRRLGVIRDTAPFGRPGVLVYEVRGRQMRHAPPLANHPEQLLHAGVVWGEIGIIDRPSIPLVEPLTFCEVPRVEARHGAGPLIR